MDNKNLLTSFIEFIESSISDKEKFTRFIICLVIFISGIGGITWVVLDRIKPQKVQISDRNITIEGGSGGILTVSKDKTKSIIMTLPSNGGKNDLWVDPGIMVSKGDEIKITASGKINLSLAGLVKTAEKDTKLKIPWNGPDGLELADNINPNYPESVRFTTIPNKPFGMLIAGVKDNKLDEIKTYLIGKERRFEVESDGKLLLTVNDIWLSPENKHAYLPPLEENYNFYKKNILHSIHPNLEIAREKTKDWTKQDWDEKVKENYNKRELKWDKITNDKNYGLWYHDNIGSFSVNIIIISK